MKQQRAGYQVVQFPSYQRLGAAASRSVRHRPLIHGLFEADVTEARAILRERQATTGESLSFTAFLATCVAKAVDESKAVQAFRMGSKRLILFDDVDIATRIEREVDGKRYVIPYIIHAANRKTMRQLHDEIRTAQRADTRRALTRLRFLPIVLYTPFFWAFTVLARRRPQLWKMTVGTVGLTAVGMFGDGSGWGIPATSPNTLMVTIGGIGEKSAIVDGRSAVREYLSLTVSVDHDLVDGAPTARFTRRLKALIESAYGLDDLRAGSERAAAPAASQRQAETFHPART